MSLVLVTGAGCHLCEHAKRVLARLEREYREVDVESGEARELSVAGVPLAFLPVLVADGRLLAYGRLSERRLRKDLAA